MHVLRRCLVSLLGVSMVVLSATALGAGTEVGDVALNPKRIKWVLGPPTLPKGAKIAVLYGDPGKAGPFVMRLFVPSKYRIPMHWHKQAQNITIISGAVLVGGNEDGNLKYAESVKTGGFLRIPADSRRYMLSKGKTVIEIQAEGPFDINYVNPNDDPKWAVGSYYFPSQFELKATAPEQPVPTF